MIAKCTRMLGLKLCATVSFGRQQINLTELKKNLKIVPQNEKEEHQKQLLIDDLEDYAEYKEQSKFKQFEHLRHCFAQEIHGFRCVLIAPFTLKADYWNYWIDLARWGVVSSFVVNLYFMIGYTSFFAHILALGLLYFKKERTLSLQNCPQILGLYLNKDGTLAVHYAHKKKLGEQYAFVDEWPAPDLAKSIQQSYESAAGVELPLSVRKAFRHLNATQQQIILTQNRQADVKVFKIPKQRFKYGHIFSKDEELHYEMNNIRWCSIRGQLFWISTQNQKNNSVLFNEII